MPKYQATVHVTGLTGEDPRAVRSALDEQLRKSGLENCRIVAIDVEGVPSPPALTRAAARADTARETTWRREANIGGLLLIAAAAWAIWFFWWMLSSAPG
jgi:ferric-dicitrate binding protein FerR (iron transport regulator)